MLDGVRDLASLSNNGRHELIKVNCMFQNLERERLQRGGERPRRWMDVVRKEEIRFACLIRQ